MSTEGTSVLLANRNSDIEDAIPVAQDVLRRLAQRVRSRLVNRCSKNFFVRLGGPVQVKKVVDVVQDDAFGKTAVFGLLRFDAPRVPGLAVMQRGLLTRIIGAQLGDEAGSDEVTAVANRPLSPVESRLAQRIFLELAEDLMDCWPVRPAPGVILDGSPGTSRVIDSSSYDEDVYVAILDFGPTKNSYGLMCVAVPSQVLRSLQNSSSLSPELAKPSKPIDFERILPVEIELVAEMARLPMRIRDLRGLNVGDILPLGALEGATIRVNGKPIITAEAGHSNGQRSVRVISKFS